MWRQVAIKVWSWSRNKFLSWTVIYVNIVYIHSFLARIPECLFAVIFVNHPAKIEVLNAISTLLKQCRSISEREESNESYYPVVSFIFELFQKNYLFGSYVCIIFEIKRLSCNICDISEFSMPTRDAYFLVSYTWSRTIWDSHMSSMLRTILSRRLFLLLKT